MDCKEIFCWSCELVVFSFGSFYCGLGKYFVNQRSKIKKLQFFKLMDFFFMDVIGQVFYLLDFILKFFMVV